MNKLIIAALFSIVGCHSSGLVFDPQIPYSPGQLQTVQSNKIQDQWIHRQNRRQFLVSCLINEVNNYLANSSPSQDFNFELMFQETMCHENEFNFPDEQLQKEISQLLMLKYQETGWDAKFALVEDATKFKIHLYVSLKIPNCKQSTLNNIEQ